MTTPNTVSELPAEAQAHVDQLHPDVQQVLGNQLMRLSHVGLYVSPENGDIPSADKTYDTPVPVEVSEAHQPHVDLVQTSMNRASAALRAAHDTLYARGSEATAMSSEALAATAHQQLVETAAHEKQTGNTQAATEALETALVIQALTQAPYSPDERKTLVHQAVSKDLATEMVQATHNTFGLVSVSPAVSEPDRFRIVPTNHLGQQNAVLLHTASELDFNDNFSRIQEQKDQRHTWDKTQHLSQLDLVCLAEGAKTRSEPAEARTLLQKAFDAEPTKSPDTVAELLIEAQDLKLPELDDKLAKLRGARKAGEQYYGGSDTQAITGAIPKLVEQGREELTLDLLSSHSKELDNLAKTGASPATLDKLADLHDRKQQALITTLQVHGASEKAVRDITDIAVDPDAAASVSPEFWEKYDSLEFGARYALYQSRETMAPTANAIAILSEHGVIVDTHEIVDVTKNLPSPEAQAHYATSVSKAWHALGSPDKDSDEYERLQDLKAMLAKFADPMAAVQTLQEAFGSTEQDGIQGLQYICRESDEMYIDTDQLLQIPEGFGLVLKGLTTSLDKRTAIDIAATIRQKEDPTAYGRQILAAIDIAGDLLHGSAALTLLATTKDPEAQAKSLMNTWAELQKRGVTLDDVGGKNEAFSAAYFNQEPSARSLDILANKLLIEPEINKAYEAYWRAKLSPDIERGQELLGPQLDGLPHLHNQLTRLGLDDQLAQKLFESWRTLNRYPRELEGQAITVLSMTGALNEQRRVLMAEMQALTDYVERYGLGETLAIIDTFGIHHFARYNSVKHPDQLHKQLEAWRDGKISPHSIVATALTDHNNAMGETGDGYEELDQEGLFFFEVGNRTDLAKIAVAIGNRERQNGRNPLTDNTFKNFIISSHGYHQGIELGPHGEELTAQDYIDGRMGIWLMNRGTPSHINGKLVNRSSEPSDQSRPNDFRRHLGTQFRIILHACNTGKEGGFAEAMSDAQSTETHGAEKTVGSIVIQQDGSVMYFLKGAELMQVYGRSDQSANTAAT